MYGLAVMLGQRFVVSCIIGATVDPTPREARALVWGLAANFAFLLGYIVVAKPFIIAAANWFEAVAVLSQLVCILLNFWVLDENALGVHLSPVVAGTLAILPPSFVRSLRDC